MLAPSAESEGESHGAPTTPPVITSYTLALIMGPDCGCLPSGRIYSPHAAEALANVQNHLRARLPSWREGIISHVAMYRAPALFALIVLFCDGYLATVAWAVSGGTNIRRFLAVASRLPMELQMSLCHAVSGVRCDVIQVRFCNFWLQHHISHFWRWRLS